MAAQGGESVPRGMRPLFDAVVRLTDAFCGEHLDDEYAQLCRRLAAALCRKRPSPLAQGRVETWACAVVYAVGGANFLFDRSQTPHVSAGELCDWFGVAKSTAAAKAGAIRRMLGVHQGDPRWYRPSQLGENPFAWLIEVDGLVVDARRAPRAIQEQAFRLGLIPYLPGDPAFEPEEADVALSASQLEQIAAWCATSRELAAARAAAQREFFGEDDARPVDYMPGAGDSTSRERRFLGWFALAFRLPDGRRPAELAADALLRGSDLADALDAVRHARYALAIVTSTDGRRSTFLELEDERFEVRNSTWPHVMTRGRAVVAHLVPVRDRFWLPGPGWLEWPVRIGPNMRRELGRFQPDPIAVERLLQQRGAESEDDRDADHARDATLEQAVARMTAAAERAGRPGLVLPVDEWRALVLRHLADVDPMPFFHEVVARVGELADPDELNRWLGLANNIWNATSQPDRGGRTAYELTERSGPPRRG